MRKETSMVIINGMEYNVGTASVSRTYRKEYKYQVTTEDGRVHSEVRAVYADFVLSLGNVDAADYDRLMAVLLEAVGDVTVVLPVTRNSSETYTGTFDGVGDEIIAQDDESTTWDNLTLNFTGTVPLEVGSA